MPSSAVQPIIVRPAEPSDMAAVAVLMEQLGYQTSVDDMEGRYAVIGQHPDYATLVACSHVGVVGMIGLVRFFPFEANGCYVRIGAMVVSTASRARGIGTKLMEEAQRWALQRGATYMSVNSGNRAEREGAHAFYIKMGFDPVSTGFKKQMPSTD